MKTTRSVSSLFGAVVSVHLTAEKIYGFKICFKPKQLKPLINAFHSQSVIKIIPGIWPETVEFLVPIGIHVATSARFVSPGYVRFNCLFTDVDRG